MIGISYNKVKKAIEFLLNGDVVASIGQNQMVTPWIRYWPTLNAGVVYDPNSTRFEYRTCGGNLEIRADIKFTAAGSGGVPLKVSLPPGYSISDSGGASDYPNGTLQPLGPVNFLYPATGTFVGCSFIIGGSNFIVFSTGYTASTSGGNQAAPMQDTFTVNGSFLAFTAAIKVRELNNE